MVLPIYTFDHDVLRQETSQVEQDSAEIAGLIVNMFETMNNANGIGLAANQVGRSLAMTVIDIGGMEGFEEAKPMVLINPVITGTHGESVFEEGCLSLPDIREDIIRPESVGVKYLDQQFREVEIEANMLLARVIQHEIDHLHGKYFIDYLSPLKLGLLKGKLTRMNRGEVECEYPLAPPPPPRASKKSSRVKLPRL